MIMVTILKKMIMVTVTNGDDDGEDHEDDNDDKYLSSVILTPVGDTNIPLPMMHPTIT